MKTEEKNTEIAKGGEVTKKQQKYSVSYGLKALANHVNGLAEAGVINDEEWKTIMEIKDKAVNKFIIEQYK